MGKGCPFVKKTKRRPKKTGRSSSSTPGEENVGHGDVPRAPRVPRAKNSQADRNWMVSLFGARRSERKTESQLRQEEHETLSQKVLEGANEHKMEIYYEAVKGRCVRPRVDFHKGEFVLEYKGKMIPYHEATRKEDLYSWDDSVGSFMYFFDYKGNKWCVDATEETEWKGRLINHSILRPNLKTKTIEIKGQLYLIFVAIREIRAGEELLYDYGEHSAKCKMDHPWLVNS